MGCFLFGTLIVLFSIGSRVTESHFNNSSRFRLLQTLFGNNTFEISREVPPFPANNGPLRVCFKANVHQILELNQKKQVMNLNLWLRVSWENIYLKWNPNDFGGIESITVDKEKIWVPDLTLWNRAANDASMFQRMDTRIKISHNGRCSWHAPVTTTSTCEIRVKDFPFDNQTCTLEFGSWLHAKDEITLNECEVTCANNSFYMESSEWSLDRVYAQATNKTYDGGEYSYIVCELSLSRKSLFYIMNIIVPCTIIALLGCLTFYLPANNGERASLVITVLLAMTVYMLIVAEAMPPTSESLPLVQKFYLITIVETAFCLLATCAVVKWHENTAPMPDWVYITFNCTLRRLLCVKYQPLNDQQEGPILLRTPSARRQRCSATQNQNNRKMSEISEEFPSRHSQFTIQENAPDVLEYSPPRSVSSYDNKDAAFKGEKKNVPRDWQLAAKVLNKVFLVVFTTMFIISISVIFTGAMHR